MAEEPDGWSRNPSSFFAERHLGFDVSWLRELQALLRASDLRVTFDLERDVTKPCFTCGSEAEPRVLRVVGSYLNEHRDDMVRPLCPRCALK